MQNSRFIRGIAPLAACALLLPITASAQTTPFTATGWVNGVQSPGIACTNALGQVFVRGILHTARVQASDARVTGQVVIIADGAYNANGTANLQGPSYLQVGTWDAAGTTFTPTGGLWEMRWNGVMQTNFSVRTSIAAYGSGGAIDGWRSEWTLTRAAAAGPVDPSVPYLYTGTIKPPPVNTTEVYDDFTQPYSCPVYGFGTCTSGNGQFIAVGDFPKPTESPEESFLLGGGRAGACTTVLSVANGTTREWRVDMVSLDDNATNMAELAVTGPPGSPGYALTKGGDFAWLLKWSKNYSYSVPWCDRTGLPLPHKNVVLAVALSREDPNVVITARVLDKADPNDVLFAHSYVDTPGSESSLTGAQFEALTGMRFVDLVPDAAEAPPTQVGGLLGLFQYTDGQQPVPTAVYENFELRTSEIPFVGIEQAVRLSWPASATINYAVEGAPTVQGPWLPVQDQTIPGFQTVTVPVSSPAQFFRLVLAP
ncbi:MAG: hypothetical protein AB9869_24795 [Verrucomicrobiia bacterium]